MQEKIREKGVTKKPESPKRPPFGGKEKGIHFRDGNDFKKRGGRERKFPESWAKRRRRVV